MVFRPVNVRRERARIEEGRGGYFCGFLGHLFVEIYEVLLIFWFGDLEESDTGDLAGHDECVEVVKWGEGCTDIEMQKCVAGLRVYIEELFRNLSCDFRSYVELHCCAGIRCEKVCRHLVRIVSCGYR